MRRKAFIGKKIWKEIEKELIEQANQHLKDAISYLKSELQSNILLNKVRLSGYGESDAYIEDDNSLVLVINETFYAKPSSYLKAFIDELTEEGYEPYHINKEIVDLLTNELKDLPNKVIQKLPKIIHLSDEYVAGNKEVFDDLMSVNFVYDREIDKTHVDISFRIVVAYDITPSIVPPEEPIKVVPKEGEIYYIESLRKKLLRLSHKLRRLAKQL